MRHRTSWPILALAFAMWATVTGGQDRVLPSPQGKEIEALDKLKAEREKLLKQLAPDSPRETQTDDGMVLERSKLRLEIVELLKRLEEQKAAPPTAIAVTPKIKPLPPEELAKSLDPLNQAKALYLSGNYEAALKAFRLIDSSSLARDDRTFIQYMVASCLRRLGDYGEAKKLYREVADAGEQPFLKECAEWQLSNIKWRQDLESQLDDLRKRLKK